MKTAFWILTAGTAVMIVGCASEADRNARNLMPSKTVVQVESRKEKPAGDAELQTLLTSNTVAAREAATLQVTSPVLKDGGLISFAYSDLGEKISPPLKISGLPQDTRSVVIVMEDPDAAKPRPFDHWVLWDLPVKDAADLPEGVPNSPRLPAMGGAMQGMNDFGSVGYFGPHPPVDHGAHRYYIQVFALDVNSLDLPPKSKKDAVVAAMQGHVIAKGVLMGRFDNEVK